ncbi:hypothetical protein ACVILH_001424 [Bradyrhizobium sp. USDA 4353]
MYLLPTLTQSPAESPIARLRLQTSPTGSAMLAKMCNRQLSEPTSWPGNSAPEVKADMLLPTEPGSHGTVFMVGVQHAPRWRLMVRSAPLGARLEP